MNKIKKINIITSLLLFIVITLNAQQQSDRIKKDEFVFSKFHVTLALTGTMGFNLGEKALIASYNRFYGNLYGYTLYKDLKEKPRLGGQLSVEFITPSFRDQSWLLRFGFGVEKLSYGGKATTIKYTTLNANTGVPPIYRVDTCVGCYKYFYDESIFHFSILPQFNIKRNPKIPLYIICGPSFSYLYGEYYPLNGDIVSDEWKDVNSRVGLFGIAALGTTFKISDVHYLETQFRFNCQVFTTPAYRRLASAGLRIGLLF